MYIIIFILLLFSKPFIFKKNNMTFELSKNLLNIKLFILVLVIFICTEIERVSLIFLYYFSLFYLCNSYSKEKDILLIICNLFYFKKQRENSYIHILFFIAARGFIILMFDLLIFINSLLYYSMSSIMRKKISSSYKLIVKEIN